jgi:hypothetical protein
MENHPQHCNFNIEFTITNPTIFSPLSYFQHSAQNRFSLLRILHATIAESSNTTQNNPFSTFHPSLWAQYDKILRFCERPFIFCHIRGREYCASPTAISRAHWDDPNATALETIVAQKSLTTQNENQQQQTPTSPFFLSLLQRWDLNWKPTTPLSVAHTNCPEAPVITMPELEIDENGNLKPPIGLEMTKDDPDHKTTTTTRFEWEDAVGNKVKKDVPVFGSGKVETFLKWRDNINGVINEQKLTTAEQKIAHYNQVLKNPARNHYNNGICEAREAEEARIANLNANLPEAHHAQPNYEHTHEAGYKAMRAIIFPEEAYTAQCTWLTQTVQKPMTLTMQEFIYCMEEINAYLGDFPVEEGQMATPLNDLELKELMFRAIPKKWHLKLKDKNVQRHKLT